MSFCINEAGKNKIQKKTLTCANRIKEIKRNKACFYRPQNQLSFKMWKLLVIWSIQCDQVYIKLPFDSYYFTPLGTVHIKSVLYDLYISIAWKVHFIFWQTFNIEDPFRVFLNKKKF